MPTQPQGDPRTAMIEELIDALRLFTVESDVFVEVFARAHRLGRSDLNAIMWISAGMRAGRPVTLRELAGNLGLGAPATTALVDRLEAAGHVSRARDPQDRRRVTLTMQPSALRLAMEFFTPLGQRMHETLATTPTTHLRQATALIRELTGAVVQTRQETAAVPD